VHAEHHEIRILNELLESRTELCDGCPIDDAMIGADAEIDHVCLLDAVSILSRIVIDQLCHPVRLSNCNNRSLRAQNGRHEVATANIANTADTEGAIVEVSLGQASVRCTL